MQDKLSQHVTNLRYNATYKSHFNMIILHVDIIMLYGMLPFDIYTWQVDIIILLVDIIIFQREGKSMAPY